MAATLDVAQVGAYVEVSEESLGVAQVGAYVEVLYTRVLISQVGAYVEIGPGPQTVTLDALTLVGSIPAFSIIPGAVTVGLDALTLAGSIPAAFVSTKGINIQTTWNLPNSIRAQKIDFPQQLTQADKKHSDTSKGKL